MISAGEVFVADMDERRRWARTMLDVLTELSSTERAVVTLGYLRGRSHAEIARDLGLSKAAVGRAMASALAAIGRAQVL